MADCDELFGDTIDRVVTWHDQARISARSPAGRSRLRIRMSRADLYSAQVLAISRAEWARGDVRGDPFSLTAI